MLEITIGEIADRLARHGAGNHEAIVLEPVDSLAFLTFVCRVSRWHTATPPELAN